jgi:hypothetical protein
MSGQGEGRGSGGRGGFGRGGGRGRGRGGRGDGRRRLNLDIDSSLNPFASEEAMLDNGVGFPEPSSPGVAIMGAAAVAAMALIAHKRFHPKQ